MRLKGNKLAQNYKISSRK